MKAKKTASGKWNVHVLDYVDMYGKRHVRSFTAGTKAKAELLAAKFKADRTENGIDGSVSDMVERSIREKAASLSPSTVRGYYKILENMIEPTRFGEMRVSTLTTPAVQQWVSWMVRQGYSQKSVKNAVGLFTSCYTFYGGEKAFRVRLPQASARRRRVPSESDVKAILQYFDDRHDTDMMNAIRLCAFVSLRRGEISALTAGDIDRAKCTVRVNKSMTETPTREWVVKVPKTASSVRVAPAPRFVIDALPTEGRIVPLNPDVITNMMCRAVKELPVMPFTFHDLRHFFASSAHNNGMSDITTQSIAGWSSPQTMKEVYWGEITEETQRQTKMFHEHLEKEFSFLS